MHFSRVLSAATYGIEAFLIDVETHIERTLPAFSIVGLPDSAVRESRERIGAALRNGGFEFPNRKITINLAPADIRKEGSGFDLPMAIGILTATHQVTATGLESLILIGELALDGCLRPVHGILSVVLEARRMGIQRVVVPAGNGNEAALVTGVQAFPMETLRETVEFLNTGSRSRRPIRVDPSQWFSGDSCEYEDFSDVKGQQSARRALEVAAAGGHNIILVGPPGSGKTMLAKRLPGILPPLTFDEALETTRIHSVAGLLPLGVGLVRSRPFRSPHHTISHTALVGGGSIPRPGEISLSHHGILFLDELPEFARHVLDVLRQPLEEGHVTISRSRICVRYPADFMLVCAMNSCPCGYRSDPSNECHCQPWAIHKYLSRVSGPLLDRIDIHIEVHAVKFRDMVSTDVVESSATIRERVLLARQRQAARFGKEVGFFSNAGMRKREIRTYCNLEPSGEQMLKTAITRLGLSARAYDKVLKVARTVADLSGDDRILLPHLSEAIQYRSLDRNLGL